MKKNILIGILLFSVSSYAIPVFDIDFNIGLMKSTPAGKLNYPRGSGIEIGLTDELGIKASIYPFARVKTKAGLLGIYAQYTPMKFSGKRQITTPLRFGSSTFSSNQVVESSLTIQKIDLALISSVPFITTLTGGTFNFEIGINGRYIIFHSSVTGIVGPVRQKESIKGNVLVPMIYLSSSLNISIVSLIGEVRGVSYKNANYFDFTGELRLTPFSFPGFAKFYAGIGYKAERILLKEALDANVDINVSSPFVNVGVAF